MFDKMAAFSFIAKGSAYCGPSTIVGNFSRTKPDLQSMYLCLKLPSLCFLWPSVVQSSFLMFVFCSQTIAICSNKILDHLYNQS